MLTGPAPVGFPEALPPLQVSSPPRLWPFEKTILGEPFSVKAERAPTSGSGNDERLGELSFGARSKALGLPMRGACLAASKDA